MSSEFAWLTIEQVAPLIAKRRLSPRELLESLLCHIERHNSKINAFLTMDVDGAADASVGPTGEQKHPGVDSIS